MIEFTVIREYHKPEPHGTIVFYETEKVQSSNSSVKVFGKQCQAISFHPYRYTAQISTTQSTLGGSGSSSSQTPQAAGIYVDDVLVPAGTMLKLQPQVEKHLAIINQVFEVKQALNLSMQV